MIYEVAEVTAGEQRTAVIAEGTTWKAFPDLWPVLLAEVWDAVRSQDGVRPNRNVMLYKDDRPNIEVGVEVAEPFTTTGRVIPGSLPQGRAAKTTHRGRYEDLRFAYDAIIEWCRCRELERAGARWEVYGHWDDTSADQEVEVYYLLRLALAPTLRQI
jgi:effector-binding domain-containing protein